MQPKIYRFFFPKDNSQSSRKAASDAVANYLSSEKAKLKARLKLVGEETRRAYADCEQHDPRVKEAYSKTYMTARSPPIPCGKSERSKKTIIEVIDSDTLDAAAAMNAVGIAGSIGVINMASDKYVGGGFLTGAPAQEESLCRRSTLYPCLLAVKDKFYPIPQTSVLVSPNVLIFRTGLENDFRIMPWNECFFVTVLSVAALRNPPIRNGHFEKPGHRQLTTVKIRELLRAGYRAQCRHLVLGALGCGAFKNPPQEVAEIFRSVLEEPEFFSAFDSIVFAIIDGKNVTHGRKTNNFEIFRQVLGVNSAVTPKSAAAAAPS